MKRIATVLSVFALLISICSCAEKHAPKEILFQEGADDWTIDGDAKWKFVNDELIGTLDSGAGFVMTKKSYSDFVLELEFKPDSSINSGVFIRCKERILSHTDCYEINIWDLHPNQENRTGALVSRAKPLNKVETLDVWNTYKIKNQKDKLQAWINGVLVIDLKNSDLIDGPIALQAAESGEIRFRDVRLTNLD
ncbi:MAG: DUF1080 domain-containing protein [Maribacter sp.]